MMTTLHEMNCGGASRCCGWMLLVPQVQVAPSLKKVEVVQCTGLDRTAVDLESKSSIWSILVAVVGVVHDAIHPPTKY